MLADLAYVRAGQPNESDSLGYFLFALAYAAFLWASWPLFPTYGRYSRNLLRVSAAFAAFAAWLLPATVAAVQFHVVIGGKL
jgi:hypothetical protein